MRARSDPFLPWTIGLLVESVANPPGAHCAGRVPHWVLGLTLAGECEHGPPGRHRLVVRRGDVILIRPGAVQSWQVVGRATWRTIYAVFDPRPHWLPWLAWPDEVPGHARLTLTSGRTRRVGLALARALDAYHHPGRDAIDRAFHEVEAAMLACREGLDVPVTDDDPLERARLLLEQDLAAPMTLAEVVRRSRLSRSRFARLFKERTGLAPMAYRARRRVERAQDLLRAPYLPIKRIAREVGFADARAFATRFRRLTGASPRAFRRGASRPSA